METQNVRNFAYKKVRKVINVKTKSVSMQVIEKKERDEILRQQEVLKTNDITFLNVNYFSEKELFTFVTAFLLQQNEQCLDENGKVLCKNDLGQYSPIGLLVPPEYNYIFNSGSISSLPGENKFHYLFEVIKEPLVNSKIAKVLNTYGVTECKKRIRMTTLLYDLESIHFYGKPDTWAQKFKHLKNYYKL